MNSIDITGVLAKSEPPVSLKQHIEDGLLVLENLKIGFPNLPFSDADNFWQLLYLCVVCHDLGKSHSEFQRMLKGEKHKWLQQRHELFSLPFIDGLNISNSERELIKLVVAGHHKSYDELFRFIEHSYQLPIENSFQLGADVEMKLSFESEFLGKVDSVAIHALLKTFDVTLASVNSNLPRKLILNYLRKKIKIGDDSFFNVLLLIGAFKQCDHLSSAFISKIELLESSDFGFLETKRNELLSKGLDFYPHQLNAKSLCGNTILTAPTGSGKTETSFLWLQKQMGLFGQGRVFYILPFTASINAMYERLGKDIGDKEKVGLIHGKLAEYLEGFVERENASASKEKRQYIALKLKQDYRSIVTPIKVITPFQLLKNIFGLKGFEKGMFEWVGGYFIFDEIHAYRPDIFAQIIVLLEFVVKYLNVKVFIMTATLPLFLKEELQRAIGSHSEISATDDLYEKFTRHKVVLKDGLLADNLLLIQKELDAKKKVLVVCNSVEQAQLVYDNLESPTKVLLHSNFNAFDRNDKEGLLQGEDVKLLVGTQAIEVSLDIDYDMIFTEPAPIDALIQRFGRVNRRREKGICNCYVFKERNKIDKYIYTNQEVIDRSIEALGWFSESIKEKELQKAIDYVYPCWNDKDKEEYDLIYDALSGSLRELSPFTHSSKSEEDFYKQFDGIKVLPIRYESQFNSFLNEYDFIKAESLKVQISKRRFAGFINDGIIEKRVHTMESKKDETLIQTTYFVINRKYTERLGLQLKEIEDTNLIKTDNII